MLPLNSWPVSARGDWDHPGMRAGLAQRRSSPSQLLPAVERHPRIADGDAVVPGLFRMSPSLDLASQTAFFRSVLSLATVHI